MDQSNTSGPKLSPSRRIAADLREAIERGEYLPGHQLPSASALMERYGVARQTGKNSIDLLRADGLVTSRAGAGVFVRERPTVQRLSRNRLSREARRAGRGAFMADASSGGFTPHVELAIRIELADERTADALDIQPSSEVIVRDRVMRADNHPVQLAVSRLPRSITQGTRIEQADTGPTGIYGLLESMGYPPGYFVEYVATRFVTTVEAERLNLAIGAPILTVTRIAYTNDGAPLEINDMVMAGDRYELIYEFSAHK
jgi:GntR family transcriptional regulator